MMQNNKKVSKIVISVDSFYSLMKFTFYFLAGLFLLIRLKNGADVVSIQTYLLILIIFFVFKELIKIGEEI